eukprot:Selendium_serpulae@DN1354_c0_g1_i1.p1
MSSADQDVKGASQGGAGMHLPPKNHELRKEEELELHGAPLTVNLTLPDGSKESHQIKVATEVGYVKLLVASKHQVSVNKVSFSFNGAPMIDPMSFIDHAGVRPPAIEVAVEFKTS